MKLRWIIFVLALLTIVFAISAVAQAGAGSPPQPSPEQIAKMPVRALPVQDFKMLKSGTGWVSTGNRLLWTADNGAHWKDISPSTPALFDPHDDRFSGVFFLDTSTGWVVSAVDTNDTTPYGTAVGSDALLSSTTDGGATWTTVKLPRADTVRESGGGGSIAFSDRLHGWFDLGLTGNTAVRPGALFATADGGRTWNRPKGDPRVAVDLLAVTDRDVWFAGGPDYKLYVTHDGANTVQEVSLPFPDGIDPDDYPTYGLPVFTDNLTGYEEVTYTGAGDDKAAAALFVTNDGGRTWKQDRIFANLAPGTAGDHLFSAIAGSTWILSFTGTGNEHKLMKLTPKSGRTDGANSDLKHNNCHLSFIRPDEGWMNCSGNLSSTIDGGTTWTSITPRAHNGQLTIDPVTPIRRIPIKTKRTRIPGMAKTMLNLVSPADIPTQIPYVSGIDQHLGFDKSHVLSVDDMATWWASSPYYDVGIYALNSPNRGNDPTLAKHNGEDGIAWVDAVIGQGWGIIPIWFGLQAPCACNNPTGPHAHDTYPNCRLFGHRQKNGTEWISGAYSFDPDEAYQQGIEQAKDAVTSVQKLGLDGSIIYVDSEQYTSTKACGAAARQYLSGFVDQMHNSGGVAGIYGGLYDVSDHSAADSAWVARADDRVTVWNLSHGLAASADLPDSCSPDNCWDNKKRIHQYRVDTFETWGSTTNAQVDDDIVDATIVPGKGQKNLAVAAGAARGVS
jgi:photosystem II stability/assembly factor-like uncharacterized protein